MYLFTSSRKSASDDEGFDKFTCVRKTYCYDPYWSHWDAWSLWREWNQHFSQHNRTFLQHICFDCSHSHSGHSPALTTQLLPWWELTWTASFSAILGGKKRKVTHVIVPSHMEWRSLHKRERPNAAAYGYTVCDFILRVSSCS